MAELSIKKRTGGRSARVRQDVLTHALFELVEQGYIGFSIGQIAQRANVHETTIYRRWPTREALMIDAIKEFAHSQLSVINSGNLIADLQHYLHAIAQLLQTQIGKTLMMLAFDPNLKQMNLALWQERQKVGQHIFQSAIKRDEWPQFYDQDLVFSEIFGPLFTHICLLQQPINDTMIQARVHFIISNVDFFKRDSL
ncbi:TetR/AcrR family transcriptional regulator [uncultured Acinetobacter sp.]|uniref:TetR/AcrR family transcriptional regulator n=1 Tax=uncultured Acinetobacter sp. TaxID=165433 RepID=UPI002628253C|nr:TetR/AcrR family transcriptional regulator [uncultured Acinetobacter sp.]